MPSMRGMDAMPAVESALKQDGFDAVTVIIGGKSCNDEAFVNHCRQFSPHITTTGPVNAPRVLPGMARNRCLDVLDEKFKDTTHVLFLDDDIVVPVDFAQTLAAFLETETDTAAVMGRVVTRPRSYWTHVLDYTHFWWLQVEYNIPDLGWMGGGATMARYETVKSARFAEDLASTEDTDYFKKISQQTGKTLGVCGQTTCLHYHDRRKMKTVLKYQFYNGKDARLHFHSPKVGLRSILIGIRNSLAYLKRAFLANRRYLIKRPHMLPGMIMCILFFELGIQSGINASCGGVARPPS